VVYAVLLASFWWWFGGFRWLRPLRSFWPAR
jgi:hypothetical protein